MMESYIRDRYPGDFHRTVAVRDFVLTICRRFIDRGLADRNFEQSLCCGDESRFWQRLSEALIAHEFLEVGLDLRPSRDGPDLLLPQSGANIWTEIICPEPTGVPTDWLEPSPGNAVSLPHEAILLRWTAAIKEKADKLLGIPGKTEGYLHNGRVSASEPYVIAVNAPRLRGRSFASITGISQYPFAAEAVFSIGPYAIHIDRQTLETVDSGHQHRPQIMKPNGAAVPADTFLDPRFRHISAIFAADIDETWILGNGKPTALIHNPNAVNPVPEGLLPVTWEFVAVDIGDGYRLERRRGRRYAEAATAEIAVETADRG